MIEKQTDIRALTKLLKVAAGNVGEAERQRDAQAVLAAGMRTRKEDEDTAAATTEALLTERSRMAFVPSNFSIIPPIDGAVGPLAARERPPPPLEVLKQALRVAIRLEFATVPPYLCALWSIIDQTHPVAKTIRAVAHEEMLHVALLCNFLAALGERPVLTGGLVPQYPSTLPGGVHPKLTIPLLGYGPEALTIFMEIERPEEPVPIEGESMMETPAEDKTIGEFYQAILELFERTLPDLDPTHQIAGPFVWFVLTKPDDVRQAITLIMEQGEGARGRPFVRDSRFLSHFYRFKSLALSTELTWDEPSKTLRRGQPISQPSVFALAPAAPQGYGLAVPRDLRDANDRFESVYSQMLRLLEETWKDGGHKSFVAALEHMFELTSLAQRMMRIGTPDGRGYCPAFLYRP
jgi:hypothetical protein